ncbi:hypothetical protein RB595_007808 [Gaeumannomyces hyphopodioides]
MEGASSLATTSVPTACSQSQKIAARPVDPVRLLRLLNERFGEGQFSVVMQHDQFNISAKGRLTHDEIQSQCFHEAFRY